MSAPNDIDGNKTRVAELLIYKVQSDAYFVVFVEFALYMPSSC